MNVYFKKGSAISPEPKQRGIIIAHLCNSKGKWGAGFVLALNDLSLTPRKAYYQWIQEGNGLGTTQFVEVKPEIIIANMIAQKDVKKPKEKMRDLVSYDDLSLCLITTFTRALELNYDVHMPSGIGSGLAGGNKSKITAIIQDVAQNVSLHRETTLCPSITLWNPLW